MALTSNSMHDCERNILVGGCILVFEYSYFLMELKEDEQDVQRHITAAVEQYQASGTQGNVMELIHKAFEEHGEDVETLCPILVDIDIIAASIKAHYKKIGRNHQSLSFEALASFLPPFIHMYLPRMSPKVSESMQNSTYKLHSLQTFPPPTHLVAAVL
ncbi:hypothetical protein EDC04DRAFT_3100364 [Pisolithus marmoratus]|nr:hypothetical protein EDC04DRAFT_3100364 [Pisolithus marmoratus]